jgi:predicted Zn-dependent protease
MINGANSPEPRMLTRSLSMVAAALLLASCATNPVSGKQNVVLGSMKGEQESVRRIHEQIVKGYGLYDDQAMQDYVNEVGQRLAKQSHLPDMEFKFYVVDQESINAFTTGCCNIYVHRGLLVSLNSEAELASVLGHEIGHVTARHPARQKTRGVLASIFVTGAAIATGNQAIAEMANLGATAWFQGYGREAEMEADRIGLEYATKAGYKPEAMIEVFNMFKAGERFEIEQARIEGREPRIYHSIFSSHPPPDKRAIQAAKGAANIADEPPGGWVERRDGYMERIDGIRMYHAPLGITLAFPRGWTVENQPDQVVAYTPSKDSFVVMKMDKKPANKTPREFLVELTRGVGLVGGESIESNGMEGYTALTRTGNLLDNGAGPMRVVALYRGDSVYLFFGGSKSAISGVPEADGLIQSVAQTLRSLKPSEFPLAEPYRVKILKANDKTRLADYANAMPEPRYRKEQLELMNGVYPNGNPKPGQEFKVVE